MPHGVYEEGVQFHLETAVLKCLLQEKEDSFNDRNKSMCCLT